MRVLLALPVDERMCVHPYNQHPLGLLSIAQYLQDHLPGVEIAVISGALDLDDIERFEPDLLGLTALSPFFSQCAALAEAVRARFPALPIAAGGHHVAYLPGSLPRAIDVAVRGEGEQVMLELCRQLAEGPGLDPEALGAIAGLHYWRDGRLRSTPDRESCLPAEQLPVIRNLDLCEFRSGRPTELHLVTTRGCPYRCRFCSSAPFWKGVRYLPAASVAEQIEYYLDHFAPEQIEFADDLMIASKEHLRGIHELIIERGLHRRSTFTCWATGKHLDDETLRLLREMNVTGMSIAIESGSPEVYRYLKGTWSTPEENADAVRRAHAAGVFVHICVIVGSPPETVEDLECTLQYLEALPCHNGTVSLLRPYPGSRLWQEAAERGLVSDGLDDWSRIESDDVMDPATIFLGERATRAEVHRYMQAMRELFEARREDGGPTAQ